MQRKKGKAKKVKVADDLAPPPLETPTATSTKKNAKRKRGANSNQVEQEGWPLHPRTLMQFPEGFTLGRAAMKTLVRELSASEYATPFLDPVDPEEAPGYSDMIETPMDLGMCI